MIINPMKIKINEIESYNLNLPEELEVRELSSIIRRLKVISSLATDEVMDSKSNSSHFPSKSHRSRSILLNDKDKCLQFLKLWSEDKQKAKDFCTSLGLRSTLSHQTYVNLCAIIRKKWNI